MTWESAEVRLGTSRELNSHWRLAASISASASRPFRNSPLSLPQRTAPRARRDVGSGPERARSRHQAQACGRLGEVLNTHGVDVHRGLVVRATSARKAHFFWLLSTRCMRKSGLPASRMAMTSPGKPAPDPRSSQSRASGARPRSWAESAKWRDHSAERVDGATRLVRFCQ